MSSDTPISINIRVSSLAAECPRKRSIGILRDMLEAEGYAFNEERRNIGASVGTGFHAGAHNILSDKLSGRKQDIKYSVEVGIETFKAAIKEGVDYDGKTKNRNDGEQQIKTLTEVFSKQVAPNIEPVMMEKPLERRIAHSEANVVFTLIGHPDCIEIKKITDYKSGRIISCYPAQLGGYDILAEKEYGVVYEKNIIVWLPRVPVKKPYPGPTIVEWPVDVCVNEALAAIKAIKYQVGEFLKTKSPLCFPSNPGSWLCSEKYCEGYGTDYCRISQVDNGKRK